MASVESLLVEKEIFQWGDDREWRGNWKKYLKFVQKFFQKKKENRLFYRILLYTRIFLIEEGKSADDRSKE